MILQCALKAIHPICMIFNQIASCRQSCPTILSLTGSQPMSAKDNETSRFAKQ